MKYDYLVVGSGLYGAVFAKEATDRGKKVLVIDKRPNVAGNIYTETVEGIHVHKYGAHIFHTNDTKVWKYITRFAEFNRFTNSPVANYHGELYSLPFNMYTFNKMWGVVTPEEAAAKIEEQRQTAGITEPKNLEEQAISLVGKDIFEKLVKGYTEKQWGRDCKDLPAFIIKRLPVRLTFDNNYFNALYQGIPIGGYTKLVEHLLEGIEVRLNTDYLEQKEELDKLAETVVYTGPIDAYFGYSLGALEYRSVRFETEVLDIPNFQGNAAVNYTDRETPWTRIIEHKWFEFGTHGRKTFAAALAGTCVIAVCLLTGVGVNAATDGALFDSIREFCGLPVQQKKAADEGLKLKNEVYAPELAGCSEKYVVFANERALMVYGRQEKRLLAALDLQAMDCNYFNTDSIHTRVLLQKDTIYIFNEKKEQQPTQMYVYDLKKTDVSSALSVTEDVRKLELVYREWKTFSAENSLDTFSGMADGDYWNSLINFGKDGKETGVYSQQCIVWTDRAGRQYRSALVIIGGDDYELYSCPADDTEKISKEKLLVQTLANVTVPDPRTIAIRPFDTSGVAPAKVVSLPKRVAAKKAAKRTAVVPVKRSLQLVK